MYYLFVLGSVLSLILPRRFCYVLAKFLATYQFYISRKDREAVIYNLSAIFDDRKIRRKCAKEVFINFAYYLVDFFKYPKLNPDFIKKYVKISGLENLDDCLSQHKGVIALTAHLGNYELAAAVTASFDYALSVIALPHKDQRLNRFFNKRRQAAGMKVISTGVAIKSCFWALQRGELLALLGDRDFSGKGIKFKMFSRWAYFPRGAAFFACKTNASIVPAFLIRKNKYFYHLFFEKPIVSGGDGFRREADLIKQYIRVLESYIKKYPNQWYIFEKYWLPEENAK